MSGDARVGSTARRWEIALACAAAALVLAAVAVAAFVAVPPTIANLSSEVSDGSDPTDLGDASVVVPADWVVTRHSEDAITVRTPDGALRASLESVDESPGDVVAAAAGGSSFGAARLRPHRGARRPRRRRGRRGGGRTGCCPQRARHRAGLAGRGR